MDRCTRLYQVMEADSESHGKVRSRTLSKGGGGVHGNQSPGQWMLLRALLQWWVPALKWGGMEQEVTAEVRC